jgi:hypothetical protein
MTDKELLIKYAEKAYRAAIEEHWMDVRDNMARGIQMIDMS